MRAFLFLPNTIHKTKKRDLSTNDVVIFMEHPYYFSRYKFHKQKLILHRASMKAYAESIVKKNIKVIYIEHDKNLRTTIEELKINEISTYDPIDIEMKDQLNKLKLVKINFLPNPGFLYTKSDLNSFHEKVKDHKRVSHGTFYKWSLEKNPELKNLINENLDRENRKVYRGPNVNNNEKNINIHVSEAIKYVEKNFPDTYGYSADFKYPVTHAQASKWFDTFLENRLIHYGDYQDSYHPTDEILFHSCISSSLNCGLITVRYCLDKCLQKYNTLKKKISLNNFEGFIRQLIGWREYMKFIYEYYHDEVISKNVLKCNKKISKYWYEIEGHGLEPVDDIVRQALQSGYMNHIQRLMVILNYMILSEITPSDIFVWFMEISIDSYDWVMIPNIYAMGGFTNKFMSRPYLSSSKYLLRMGWPKGDWTEIWDERYRSFLKKRKNNKYLSFYNR